MTTIRERILVWLITSMLAVGAWLLLTSFAMGANNFPVPVLAESLSGVAGPIAIKLYFEKCGHEARESTKTPASKAGTLAAGDSFRSGVLPTPASGAFLAHAPRLASTARTPADSNLSAWRNVKTQTKADCIAARCHRQIKLSSQLAGSNPAALISVGRTSDGKPDGKRSNRDGTIGLHFLDAIERVESNGNPHAIGDKGRARGPFQFWAVAWSDCSRVRSKRGQSVADYWSATNRAIARSYATTYLGMLHHQLTRALRRTPTHTELYAAWNMGFTAYRRTGFSLARCPESTRRAAARINSMLR